MKNPILNVADVDLADFASPNRKFEAKLGRIGASVGAEKLGCMFTIVEPGKRAFPFHSHHAIEEMFYIIEGEGEYRFGDKTHAIHTGDVVSAPTGGRERAHQIINTGDAPIKYLSISTMDKIDVVEYPDSDKFLTFASEDGTPQTAKMRFIGRESSAVGYFDGEDE